MAHQFWLLDGSNDAVWGFTNGARDSSKDISQAVLQSADQYYCPWRHNMGWHISFGCWTMQTMRYGVSPTERVIQAKDISQAVLQSAASNISPFEA